MQNLKDQLLFKVFHLTMPTGWYGSGEISKDRFRDPFEESTETKTQISYNTIYIGRRYIIHIKHGLTKNQTL